MDREIAPEVRRRALMRRVTLTLIALAAIGFSLAATVEWLRPSVRRRDIETAIAGRGSVEAVVQTSGIVMPEVEQAISSPVEARVLRVHRRAGDSIRVGGELITLDTNATRLDLARLDEKVAQKESEHARLRLQVEENLDNLRAELEQKKLDGEMLRLKAEQSAELRKEGLVSGQEALLDATAAKKIAIDIKQTEQKIARAIRSGQAQLAASALDASILQKERAESRRQLDLAMMRADRDGIITAIVQEEGATVRRGDILARIADLSSFRVIATVSDLYVPRLGPGMRVRVRVDEGTTVNGTLASIDPRIENGVARLHVALDRDAHAKLRNNLRVDAFVVTSEKKGVLQVKRGTLAQSAAEEVFVVRRGRLIRVPVRWGSVGQENVEIVSGIQAGDEVVVSNMNDYDGLKEVRLR
ncbi:MAG TPA: HlyD family efflux transporter periplasmic adaptor subunit [Thermoanaerobaculia bacterium]|nr:HlyD family efflux transporter periplasmic adaptor subunit [Thermoanaerobaculia bacterium]